MAKHTKTLEMLATAIEVLQATNPMTVRQVYYQLVSRQVIKNKRSQYQAVSNMLRDARKEQDIPWEWIEDRLRKPRAVSMWKGLPDFADTALRAYRRNVWDSQPGYVEIWLEKDALSGIFEDVLNRYGVTLNVGRGYDGWDSIYNAAKRYGSRDHKTTILYFGDLDPSGEDMVRSLRERLLELDSAPHIVKCALTLDDVTLHNLPPDFTKTTDTRRDKFVEKFGDVSVELDALPLNALRDRLTNEVEALMDLNALEATLASEAADKEQLAKSLGLAR